MLCFQPPSTFFSAGDWIKRKIKVALCTEKVIAVKEKIEGKILKKNRIQHKNVTVLVCFVLSSVVSNCILGAIL